MEEESFEDEEIATFLNTHYLAIKVDREERPDIDAIYMSAVQRLTGQGGWPMSMWLTADREPFFGGTYFPPRDGARGARHGFLSLLGDIAETFHRDPERVRAAAAALVNAVRQDMTGAKDGAPGDSERPPPAAASLLVGPDGAPLDASKAAASALPSLDIVDATVAYFKRAFDTVEGGVRRAPKFPSNLPVRLMLRVHARTGDKSVLHMAMHTLRKMAAGGIYDQLAGGFHRYSTDARWLVPHFEKMLYDNALLAVAYAEAYQVTGAADLARVARETCDYVLREMTAPEGGFYSATDADSEGEEGRFFVWTAEEVRRELGLGSVGTGTGTGAEEFLAHYDVSDGGNWEGNNILNVPRPDETKWARLEAARAHLREVRARRPPPLRDEKILAAWNGLMISGLAVVGRTLDEPRFVAAATRAAQFILEHLRGRQGWLMRTFKDGQSRQPGFLDDTAFVAAGLLDLFEATGDGRWLREAVALADETERRFADPAGGWFMTGVGHETLIAREKPAYDGAEPSGTSVALMNAVRLEVITDDDRWRRIADGAFTAHATDFADRPLALTEGLLALEFAAGKPRQIAVVWPKGEDQAAEPLRAVLRRTFVAARVLAEGEEPALGALSSDVPFVRDKPAINGQPTAYVCRGGVCELPVTDPGAFEAQLRGPS
jgi:uncharacterized protein YyaL (SSP411 family)